MNSMIAKRTIDSEC